MCSVTARWDISVLVDCRMNFKAYGLDQKTLTDAIGMCLNCKEEFPSEVLRETISRLLQDEVPAAGLMRTAILSYSQV